jgi:hypothetical protein
MHMGRPMVVREDDNPQTAKTQNCRHR